MISGNNYEMEQPTSGDQSRRHRRPPYYRAKNPELFDLEKFSSVHNLKIGWSDLRDNGGPAAGCDGHRFKDFSNPEMMSVLKMLSECLMDRRYRPQPVRIHRVAKGDGRFRELSIQCISDRTVAKCLQQCLGFILAAQPTEIRPRCL